MGTKHWRIQTAADILGEPVERTRRRVCDNELPLVIRGDEELIPRYAVLGLRDRLRRQDLAASSHEQTTADVEVQHQLSTGRYIGDGQWEFSGRTVNEAIESAGSELGIGREQLVYEILDSGLLHMLGLDAGLATIAVHTDESHPSASSDPNSVDVTVSSFQGVDITEAPARLLDQEVSDDSFYSLGQAAIVLQTTHDDVKALASTGKLRGEVIGSWLWFPAKDFQEFVTRVYGKERLNRAPTPYPAEKVRQPVSSVVPNSRSASTRPPEISPQAEGSGAEIDRTETPAGDSSGRSVGTSEPASDEYLSIPDAALELGESVIDFLSRIGKKQLHTKQIRGKIMVSRQSVVALKKRADPAPPQGAGPSGTVIKPSPSKVQERGSNVQGTEEDQQSTTDERSGTDEPEQSPQKYMQSMQDELAELRTQLAAEQELRSRSEQSIRNLQKELEESKSREKQALELLSTTQNELASEKEKLGLPEVKDRLLSSIRRRFS